MKGRLRKLDVATVHEASMLNYRSHEVQPGSADWRGRRAMERMRVVRGWLLTRIVGEG